MRRLALLGCLYAHGGTQSALTAVSATTRRLPSDGSFELPDLRAAVSAPSAASDDDGAGDAVASVQLPGASDASTWANSRLRPADSADGGGFDPIAASTDRPASGEGASCRPGVAALLDDRGRAGLLRSGATGSTTGLRASLPGAPRGVPAAEAACAGFGGPGDAPSQQQPAAQRQAGEAGSSLAMLSDTVLAGYCWQYQPQAMNADGAPADMKSIDVKLLHCYSSVWQKVAP